MKETKKAEDFAKAYESLCKEYGFQLRAIPQFIPRDDGSWSTVVQISVEEITKAEK